MILMNIKNELKLPGRFINDALLIGIRFDVLKREERGNEFVCDEC